MRLDREQFLEVLTHVANNGDVGQPRPYSGRAMYGKQCIAVSGDSASVWGLAIAFGWACRCFGYDARDVPEPDTDSMGRGVVIYWPQYEWPEGMRDPDAFEDEDED